MFNRTDRADAEASAPCRGTAFDLIGPVRDGRMLEIRLPDIDGGDPVVIQATPLRPRFHKLLE